MRHDRRPEAKAIAAQRSALSHALLLFTLVAFMLQGFLTQTHIHLVQAGSPAVADTFDGAPNPGHDKSPSKGDPANCPLCQQFASAGAFVTSAAAATLLPSISVSVIDVTVLTSAVVSRVTHIWRGRAPPRD